MNTFVSRQQLLFSATILLLLVACGQGAEPVASPTQPPPPTNTPQPTQPPLPTATPEPTPTPVIIDDFVDIGGRKLHYICVGDGSPTVLLEAGLWQPALSWARIQEKLASITTVCAYDRAGLGESEPVPQGKRTVQDQVDDLQQLLNGMPVSGPYVMAAHSWGGFIVRMYHEQHPGQVLGMVLVDTAVTDIEKRVESRLPPLAADDPEWVQQFYTYYTENFVVGCAEFQAMLDDQEGPEDLNICQSEEMVRQSGNLGNIPLVVLAQDPELVVISCVALWESRAGEDKERLTALCKIRPDEWSITQQGLSELSSSGRMETVRMATHMSFLSSDSQNVVDALLEVIEQVKESE